MKAAAGRRRLEAVVVGCSAGGLRALKVLLSGLSRDFPGAVIVTFHIAPGRSHMCELLSSVSVLPVFDAEDKLLVEPGKVYLSVPDYHLLIEDDRRLALNIDEKVCNVRPAIDLLFETAAQVYGANLCGLIMTGANSDGALGLKVIRGAGGLSIVQDPREAEADAMPRAALEKAGADYVLPVGEIAQQLNELFGCSEVLS